MEPIAPKPKCNSNDDWNSSSDYRARAGASGHARHRATSRAHRRSTGNHRCPICVRGFTDWGDGIASRIRSRHVEPPRFPENPRSVCDSTLIIRRIRRQTRCVNFSEQLGSGAAQVNHWGSCFFLGRKVRVALSRMVVSTIQALCGPARPPSARGSGFLQRLVWRRNKSPPTCARRGNDARSRR